MARLPREILDMILDFVKPDPFQAKAMANSMSVIDENPTSRLWRSIFKDEKWFKAAEDLKAEPVLIGVRLRDIVASQPGTKDAAYIILRSNDFSGDISRYGVEFLRRSLRTNHHYDEKRYEVTFPAIGWTNVRGEKIKLPKIVLNVWDIVIGDEFLYIEGKRTRRLISNGTLQTSFCFLRNTKIQSLSSCDIFGIGGAISSEDDIMPACTLNLQGILKKWQVTFHDPTRRDVRPLYEGGKYVPHTLIGWEYC